MQTPMPSIRRSPSRPGWRLAMTICNALIVATFTAFAIYLAVRAGVLSLFV